LSESQKEGLIFMYQEEKLARDVYRVLGDAWGSRVFNNIKQAEQRHMNAVAGLMKKYSIPIPVSSSNTGSFSSKELQALYNTLVKNGKKSEQEAYRVGVLVEKTDIADLESRMSGAPSDISSVYSRLLRGSNNHLRAFNRALDGDTSVGGQGGGRGHGHGGGHGHGYGHRHGHGGGRR
jgi:hypothetical protein